MKISLLATSLLGIGLTACVISSQPVTFKPCEIMGDGYMIEIAVPQGNSEKAQNAIKGIREILVQSKLGREVGLPSDGTLQEVMEDYHKRYERYARECAKQSGMSPTCQLDITSCFQNEACVAFLVFDDIYYIGSPDYYKSIVRLSDGRLMPQQELLRISMSETLKLIEKHLTDNDMPVSMYGLEDGYWFTPSSEDSCRVMWVVSRGAWGEIKIPLSDVNPYLTEEGKKLFTAKSFDTSDEKDE